MLRDHTHIRKYLMGGYNEDWSQAFASGAQCKPRGTWQNLEPQSNPCSPGSTAELGSAGTRRVLGSPPWTSPNLDVVLGS